MNSDWVGEPFIGLDGDVSSGWLIVCDHARNAIPPAYGNLGMTEEFLSRHIAWDPGAEALSRALAARLGCPLVMSTFSRLLIDPNRGEHDPTLIMRLSDGVIIPGNAAVNEKEKVRRIRDFHAPYHGEIARRIDQGLAAGRPPAILSIHSFTPSWKGVPRPWHYGILWDRDDRLPRPMIAALERRQHAPVGDNEPYTGMLRGDCMNRHGTVRGLAHALIEVRNDLISHPRGVADAAELLAAVIDDVKAEPGLNRVQHYGSHTDGSTPGYEQPVSKQGTSP